MDFSEHIFRKLFSSRNTDGIRSFHRIHSSPDHRINESIRIAAVAFGCTEGGKKGVIKVLPYTPIFHIQFDNSHDRSTYQGGSKITADKLSASREMQGQSDSPYGLAR